MTNLEETRNALKAFYETINRELKAFHEEQDRELKAQLVTNFFINFLEAFSALFTSAFFLLTVIFFISGLTNDPLNFLYSIIFAVLTSLGFAFVKFLYNK